MDDSEEALKRAKFIIKLAESTNLKDVDVNQAILAQLREAEGNNFFPSLYQSLVPANYSSITKLASDMAKRRLTEATRLYSIQKKKT